MKKYLLLALTLCAVSAIHAQISLSDLVNGKVDSSKVVIEGSETPTDTVTAIIPQPTIAATSNLLSDVLSKELYIIRQQYRLQRDGQYFGKNNRPYYGESYSLGIKVRGGMLLTDDVLQPWKNDPDYSKIKDSGNYIPELFMSYQRPLNNKEYKNVELELGTIYVSPFTADSALYIHKDAYVDFGLELDENAGKKNGYMVWIYTDAPLDSAMNVTTATEAIPLKTTIGNTPEIIKAPKADKLLAGLYVVPSIERSGKVQFLVSGVVVVDKSKGVPVCNLHTFAKYESEETAPAEGVSEDEKDIMPNLPTPIN